jgi:hypothetical protein
MYPANITRTLIIVSLLAAALSLALGAPAFAEDLGDNEICLECHAGAERAAPDNPDQPRIHNEDGSFTVEAHEMWSCIDCHDMITDIPHPEGIDGQAVNCENCHDGTPTME